MLPVYYWNICEGGIKKTERIAPECIGNEILVVHAFCSKKKFRPGQKVSIGPMATIFHISLEQLVSTFKVNVTLESGTEKELNVKIQIGVDPDRIVKACQRLVKETMENIRENVKLKFVTLIEKQLKQETNDLSQLNSNESGIKEELNSYLSRLGLELVGFEISEIDEREQLKSEIYQVEQMLANLREGAKKELTELVVAHKKKIQLLQQEEHAITAKMKQLPHSIQSKLRQLEPVIEKEASTMLNAQEEADLILEDAEEEANEIIFTAGEKVSRLKKFAERFDDRYLVVLKLDALQSAVENVKEVLQSGVDAIEANKPLPNSFKDLMAAIEATSRMTE